MNIAYSSIKNGTPILTPWQLIIGVRLFASLLPLSAVCHLRLSDSLTSRAELNPVKPGEWACDEEKPLAEKNTHFSNAIK